MTENLFVVILKYIVPLEKIDAVRKEHLQFLDEQYQKGILIASGPQTPRTGGVLIAKYSNKVALEEILKSDPFAKNNLAEYAIYEFTPTKHSPSFDGVLELLKAN